jgi:hypothetical protein
MAADALDRDYRAAFVGYLSHRGERQLHTAYEIGRGAVVSGTSMLALSKIHHDVFRTVLAQSRPEELDDVVDAASEFFIEVLATYHMTHDPTGGARP